MVSGPLGSRDLIFIYKWEKYIDRENLGNYNKIIIVLS